VLALVGVSLLWGTYAPALRWLFLFDENLTPATLTAWRTALSAAAMLAAALATGALLRRDDDDGGGGAAAAAAEGVVEQSSGASSSWVGAGAEIGLYNFLGTACQVTGVHATTATKAAFLGQATTALTPALAALGGLKVTAVQWVACAAAVAGSALISADDLVVASMPSEMASAAATVEAAAAAAAAASSSAPAMSGGEPFVLLACVFYALSTVRMAVHAPRHGAARLATAKTSALAALSAAWAVGAAAVAAATASDGAGGFSLSAAVHGAPSNFLSFPALPPVLAGSAVGLAALAFSALGPGALATWLQASGQRRVPAAEAQVIFSLTPVWTALLSAGAGAAGVVGASAAESAMGAGAWAGSALVLAASVAVALEGRGGGGEERKGGG
jgi:drug/metabolite transporter (DMT)-like permease